MLVSDLDGYSPSGSAGRCPIRDAKRRVFDLPGNLVVLERIFVSSVARGEMAAIREASRRAIDALDMIPVMFETGPASEHDSRRALLDRVGECDAVLLLVGAEYGEALERGVSPTEEEFQEAIRSGVEVLVLVQDTEREPEMAAFLERVRGSWESGHLSATFTDASDVTYAVTRSLTDWRRRRQGGDAYPAAAAKALELAREEQARGQLYGVSKLRVVAVPALSRPLLDAVALRDASLRDDLAAAARASGLVPHSAGIDADVGRDAITFALSGDREFERLVLSVGFDGSIVSEGPVGGDASAFGGSVVMASRAREVIARTMAFAEATWQRIDSRDEVREVAMTTCVPEAAHKIYALEPVGSSMSVPMSMPQVLLAPDPPLRTRRADMARRVDALQAELQRAFEVERAVHPQ